MKRMEHTDKMKDVNSYAMTHGILLGAWGVATFFVAVLALSRPLFSFTSDFLLILSPFFATALTIRYRQKTTPPGEGFGFGRGYVHTLLTGLYACVWIALTVYIYLKFFDGGAVFDAFAALVSQPENAALFEQLEGLGYLEDIYAATGAKNMTEVVDIMRELSPANYAGMIVSTTLITAPIISAIIALFTMRRSLK